MAPSKRLLSLDILRGITIAGMLLVNNPGSWDHLYEPLDHAEWIGLTPTDLVFPFFMFCMGVAMYFSLRKFNFRPSGQVLAKIARRALILFFIGWAVQWFGHALRGFYKPDCTAWDQWTLNGLQDVRILGVFQRLALVYLFGALCVIFVKHKLIPWLIGFILVAYALILGLGNGYEFSLQNIIASIDNSLFGEGHLYHESVDGVKLAFDPEGLLSTLPGIAHVLIGFMAGKLVVTHHDNMERIGLLSVFGFSMLLGGWLLSYGIPCGKKMWSSTFVLITCGLASCTLSLLTYIIDMKGRKKWCSFFHAFGTNPLALYLIGTVLAIAFGAVQFGHDLDDTPITLHSLIYGGYCSLLGVGKLASCLYALTFIFINWIFGYLLHKKNIIIKI